MSTIIEPDRNTGEGSWMKGWRSIDFLKVSGQCTWFSSLRLPTVYSCCSCCNNHPDNNLTLGLCSSLFCELIFKMKTFVLFILRKRPKRRGVICTLSPPPQSFLPLLTTCSHLSLCCPPNLSLHHRLHCWPSASRFIPQFSAGSHTASRWSFSTR